MAKYFVSVLFLLTMFDLSSLHNDVERQKVDCKARMRQERQLIRVCNAKINQELEKGVKADMDKVGILKSQRLFAQLNLYSKEEQYEQLLDKQV